MWWTYFELALVTNGCKEALHATRDVLLAVAAYFQAFLKLFQTGAAAELLDVVSKTDAVLP
jgi:hypothetical protein